jgi:N-carbamoyl-L-amino-acid hydrolase
MTTTLVPTAMVFVRAKDEISHCAKGWSDKDDCMEGALALGKAVLNYDELLKAKSIKH